MPRIQTDDNKNNIHDNLDLVLRGSGGATTSQQMDGDRLKVTINAGTGGGGGGGTGASIIADQTLAVDTASFDFTGLDLSTYAVVTVYCNTRVNGGGNGNGGIFSHTLAQFNGDTGGNYSYILQNDTAANVVIAAENSGATSILVGHASANGSASSIFAFCRMTLFAPGLSGQMKSAELFATFNPDPVTGTGGSAFTLATFGSGWWTNTAAITEIKITPEDNQFLAGSRIVIVGT